MKTNDLKKGVRVHLRNGWFATIADNMKGNIRMATVEGHYTETGSVYAHDIVAYQTPDGFFGQVEHTPTQLKLKDALEKLYNG